MLTIDFIGIARAGKSTVAKYLEETIPNLTFYPERHDLVPDSVKKDDYEYNFWYSKYCTEKLEESLIKPGIHLFERGVIDHIVIGKVYFKMGWFTQEQLDKYLDLLNPYINKVDKVFVFRIPVDISVQRANNMGKDVTKAIPYITVLYEEYGKVKDWFPNTLYLPEDATLDELKQKTFKEIQKSLAQKVPTRVAVSSKKTILFAKCHFT